MTESEKKCMLMSKCFFTSNRFSNYFFESSNFVSFSLPTFRFVLIGIVGSISRFCNARVFFSLFSFPFFISFFFFIFVTSLHIVFFSVLYSHLSNSLLVYPFVCTQNLPASKRITSLNKINRKSPAFNQTWRKLGSDIIVCLLSNIALVSSNDVQCLNTAKNKKKYLLKSLLVLSLYFTRMIA